MKKTCVNVLNDYKITPTVQRIELLTLMVGFSRPFTIEDLKEGVQTVSIVISDSTIVTTLLLFENRKLLNGSPALKKEKSVGRPMTLYTIDCGEIHQD